MSKEQFLPYNHWLHRHDDDIKKAYPETPTAEMAQEMDINYYTVSRRAKRLNVSKSAEFMRGSWKKGGEKNKGCRRSKYSEESWKYLREHFSETSNQEIAKNLGVDVKTVRRWARRLGLVKSETFMFSVRGKGHGGRLRFVEEETEWRNRRNQRIAEVYPDADDEGVQKLADELGIKVSSLKKLASCIGLRRHNRYVRLSPQQIEDMAAYFHTHTDKECADRFGIKKNRVQTIARKLGWKKNIGHLQKIYSNNITAAQGALRKKRTDKLSLAD